jgi:enoyl-CoA hydratase/carnithine racemase
MTPSGLLDAVLKAGGLGFHIGPADETPPSGSGIVRVGLDEAGGLACDAAAFDILLTRAAHPPRPWVHAPDLSAAVSDLRGAFDGQPAAAAVCCQVLRMTLSLDWPGALALESLSYSMLLASDGFAAWRAENPPKPRRDELQSRVSLDRTEAGLIVRLTRPEARNAVDARMRDALCEALDFAAEDPEGGAVILEGQGPAFSAGGDLAEFGSFSDPGLAHAIRTLRSATERVAAIAPRVTARLHGACVGAGIEIPAAAGRVIVAPDVAMRLPEVGMGLIPGAGGTASIPRRIGRHRTAWMALSGAVVDAATALAWGLADALEPAK